MHKKDLSEADICAKYITPAVVQAGWHEATQIRREVGFTRGRIIVRGKLVTRGKARRADYVLYYQHIPIALIEAKDNNHAVGDGMQQALEYATALDIPFVFSSNGDGFVWHDRSGTNAQLETTLPLDQFPGPATLWTYYRAWKGLAAAQEEIVLYPYHDDGSGKEPRYYQRNAINATVEAIAKGQNRILLVMATGTGKAFQIIWRLWKAGVKKRILYLADRNVLIDQTMVNDFRPFGAAMAKLSTSSKTIERDDGSTTELTTAIDRQRRIDTAYEIYLGLYQAITGPEERQKLFRDFSPGFFDLIVIDECHRGSAAEDSAWREILDYFAAATQIGMTATPRETAYVSNIHYFGAPVYTYSLKQGIRDGFLAPYKVIKVHLDVDVEGYRPRLGETDQQGYEIDDRLYNQKDFDRNLVIDERTRRVARWVSDFLKHSGDRLQKTIVFCVDTAHAARMRQALLNENADLARQNPRYVMRITGDDAEGTAQLSNFIDPEATYPVIVTTSRLLSTGVDGAPVQIYEPGEDDPVTPPDNVPPLHDADDEPMPPEPGVDETIVDGWTPPDITLPPGTAEAPAKYYIKGEPVTVLAERVEYLDETGYLITESLRDYSRKTIRRHYASLDQFLHSWQATQRKEAIIAELAAAGLLLDPLLEEVGKELDPFDLICHIAFDQPPLTRRDRVANVRKRDVFTHYGPPARAVLEALLDKYQDDGVVTGLDDPRLLQIAPFASMGTVPQLIKHFGTRADFERAVHTLQTALYQASA